jgi:hypothetical protein
MLSIERLGTQIRHLTKKIQQIESLEARGRTSETALDEQQIAKIATRGAVTAALNALTAGASLASVQVPRVTFSTPFLTRVPVCIQPRWHNTKYAAVVCAAWRHEADLN